MNRWQQKGGGDFRYKNFRGVHDGRPVTTFFVSNLPDGVTDSMLWMAFKPHGIVKDAYVARKRDSRGNCFGFIRYVGVGNINEVLHNMNKVKIHEAKVGVSVARFGKGDRRGETGIGREQQHVNRGPVGNRGPVFQQTGAAPSQPAWEIPRKDTSESLYRGAVTGEPGSSRAGKKTLIIEDGVAMYPEYCIMRSVIGEVKSMVEFKKLGPMLVKGGYVESPVSYIGGRMVMMVFRDKRTAVEFIGRKEELWGELLLSANLWVGEEVPYQRVTGLIIKGMPLQLRDSSFFDKVGELFGKVVKGSDFSWQSKDNSDGRVWVQLESALPVREEVNIEWRGNKSRVWVVEDGDMHAEKIVGDLSPVMAQSPVKSSASVAGGGDELEEGEIRGEVPAGTPMAGDKNPVENEKSSNVHGLEEMHGEFQQPMGRVAIDANNILGGGTSINKENIHYNNNINISNNNSSVSLDLNKSCGSFAVGSESMKGTGPGHRSRKRPRAGRSPMSGGKDWAGQVGPSGNNLFGNNNNNGIGDKTPIWVFGDNRSEAMVGNQRGIETSSESEEVMINHQGSDNDGGMEATGQVGEAHVEGPTNFEPVDGLEGEIRVNEREKVQEEVNATIEIGPKIGIVVDGFMEELEKEIIGEGDDMVIQ